MGARQSRLEKTCDDQKSEKEESEEATSRKQTFFNAFRRRTVPMSGRNKRTKSPMINDHSSCSTPKLTQTCPSFDNSNDPSLPAATVLIDWKMAATRANEKNCNLLQNQSVRKQSAFNDELTQEFLMQIIRCFPFPSPKPSPRTSPRSSPSPERRPSTCSNTMRLCNARKNNDKEEDKKSAVVKQIESLTRKTRKSQGWRSPSQSFNEMATLKQMVVNSVDTMAITALPLDCWLKERLKHWVQLSGHEGTIVPASDKTLWKKRAGTDCCEATAYKNLMNDIVSPLVPQFTKEVEYKGESFIEIEDLTSHFSNPAIMDVKIGTRTFLEAEVKNPVSRKDLYQKMIKLDPNEPTEQEHIDQAVTKLRYMQFRERQSSTASLGFRIEAVKLHNRALMKNFQKVKTRDQVMNVLCSFLGPKPSVVRKRLLQRLKVISEKIEHSDFFKTHEVIGSSLLFMYDDKHAGVWMIDFAKALPVNDGLKLDHRSSWMLGNHEDGYLIGMDNIIQILEDSKHKELSELS